MATNYEILMSCTRKQMAAFINSLVKKEVSRYIDWNAWLLSEDPEPPYIGEPAFMKDGNTETPCYLLEETEENGETFRTVFMPGAKGEIRKEILPAHFVRKETELIYPAAPLPDLSEEEVREVDDESSFILETLLEETEKEADDLDEIIKESLDFKLEEELNPNDIPSSEEEAEVIPEEISEAEAEELPEIVADDEVLIEEDEEPAVEETPAEEEENSAEEIPEAQEDEIDFSILQQLEDEVLAADRAEEEKTSSLRFDDLWAIAPAAAAAPVQEEDPAEEKEEPQSEEEETVDFFEAQDKAAAANDDNDYYSRGRIELLKESLFDDEDEPPLGTGDLVFMETTAIQLDPSHRETIPAAADLDEGIRFADVKIPKKIIETAEKAESTSSLELGEDEDADSFFEKLKDLSEAEEPQTDPDDLNLELLKKESAELIKKKTHDAEEEEAEENPEEEELDFRSATLAQLLIDKKKTSMLYDPNDPEDQELPTIAFSALNNEEEEMF